MWACPFTMGSIDSMDWVLEFEPNRYPCIGGGAGCGCGMGVPGAGLGLPGAGFGAGFSAGSGRVAGRPGWSVGGVGVLGGGTLGVGALGGGTGGCVVFIGLTVLVEEIDPIEPSMSKPRAAI